MVQADHGAAEWEVTAWQRYLLSVWEGNHPEPVELLEVRRAVVVGLAFWLVSTLFLGIGAIAANPSSDAEGGFVGRIGDERAAAGLAGYTVAPDLVEVARRHAEEMRRQQRLHHNPRLADDVQDWETVGENVGVGPTVEAIHQKFMESPTHRANILHGRYTQVGVGVVSDGPDLWVVQVFRLPRSSGAGSAAAPAEPASPEAPAESGSAAPAPEPRPAGPSSPSTGAGVRAASSAARPPATSAATTAAATSPEPVSVSVSAEIVAVTTTEVRTSPAEPAPTTSAVTPSTEAPIPTTPAIPATTTVVETDVRSAGERQVTWPVAFAASLLLGVVAALAVHVGGGRVRSVAADTGSRSSMLDVWELAFAG